MIPPFETVRRELPIPVLPGYETWEKMYWHAWELAWRNLRLPAAGSGLVSPYLNGQLSHTLSLWHTAFEVQFGIYGRRAFPFIQALDNFYLKQHPNGFIGRELDPQTGREIHLPFDPNSYAPPIVAWAEWRYFRHTGDEERLKKVFQPLVALYRWGRDNRTWRDGLYWSTGRSSGMFNQERVPDGLNHHRHWVWVGETMQAAVSCLALQLMALNLGEKAVGDELAHDLAQLRQNTNQLLWNDERKIYQDVGPTGRFSPIKSLSAYWALLDKDFVPEERLEAMLRHLRDPQQFKRPVAVPSQAMDSPDYSALDGNYWQGGVWSPLVYVLLKGLRMVGQPGMAHLIAKTHLQKIGEVFEATNTFWEYYAPEVARPGENARPDFVGWTGLSPISMLLEDILGILVDWPQRRVQWDLRLESDQFYGVQNLPIGPSYTLDLLTNNKQLIVTTDVPITLMLRTPEMSLQKAIAPGTTEIPLT